MDVFFIDFACLPRTPPEEGKRSEPLVEDRTPLILDSASFNEGVLEEPSIQTEFKRFVRTLSRGERRFKTKGLHIFIKF